jgi:hypothetical protein
VDQLSGELEYLKLFEPSMLDEEEEHQLLPNIEYHTLHGLEELKEDIVLQHKEWITYRAQHEMWKIGLKGQTAKKVKWYERNHIASNSPHLSLTTFGDQNPPDGEV